MTRPNLPLLIYLIFFSMALWSQNTTDSLEHEENSIQQKINEDTVNKRNSIINQILEDKVFTICMIYEGCFSHEHLDFYFQRRDSMYSIKVIGRKPHKTRGIICRYQKKINMEQMVTLKELIIYGANYPSTHSCSSSTDFSIRSKEKAFVFRDDECIGIMTRLKDLIGIE